MKRILITGAAVALGWLWRKSMPVRAGPFVLLIFRMKRESSLPPNLTGNMPVIVFFSTWISRAKPNGRRWSL